MKAVSDFCRSCNVAHVKWADKKFLVLVVHITKTGPADTAAMDKIRRSNENRRSNSVMPAILVGRGRSTDEVPIVDYHSPAGRKTRVE